LQQQSGPALVGAEAAAWWVPLPGALVESDFQFFSFCSRFYFSFRDAGRRAAVWFLVLLSAIYPIEQ
jgi:hypothetical protein